MFDYWSKFDEFLQFVKKKDLEDEEDFAIGRAIGHQVLKNSIHTCRQGGQFFDIFDRNHNDLSSFR